MTRKPGKSWWRMPDAAGASAAVLKGLAITVSLGLIAVSAILNYRMGYRSADNMLDGTLYGSAAALGDGLKAMAPFAVAAAWKRRDLVGTAASMILFAVFTLYSFTAALGFSAQHREVRGGIQKSVLERKTALARDLAREERRLGQMGAPRSPTQIRAAIEGRLQTAGKGAPLGVTDPCRTPPPAMRRTCAEVVTLKEELASAEAYEDQRTRVGALQASIAALGTEAGVTSSDPQIDVLDRIIGIILPTHQSRDVAFGLAILMALFIEFGSGLGLYVALLPWRPSPQPAPPMIAATNGGLESYAVQRLEPDMNGELALADIYADYIVWCRWRGTRPLPLDAFGKSFTSLTRKAGILSTERADGVAFRQVKLLGRPVGG